MEGNDDRVRASAHGGQADDQGGGQVGHLEGGAGNPGTSQLTAYRSVKTLFNGPVCKQ